MMEPLQSVLDQLKAAGLTPHVTVQINLDSADPAALQALKTSLDAAGVSMEVQVHLNLDGAGLAAPGAGQGVDKSGPTYTVVVTDNKLNGMEFTKKDGGGKPIMEIHEPRIQILRGARLQVSANFKAGDKDTGDGVIIGTGGLKYLYVIDCPSNRQAEGFFIKQESVQRA
jgi:hypothetical protein